MPSPFNGRWALVAVENAVAFYETIKSPAEYIAKLRQLGEAVKQDQNAYVEELSCTGSTFHRQAWVNGEKKKDSGDVTFGVEFDGKTGDGRPAKVKVVLESDNKVVRSEKGDGFSSTSTFVVNGDELIVTLSSGSVSSTEKFKRLA